MQVSRGRHGKECSPFPRAEEIQRYVRAGVSKFEDIPWAYPILGIASEQLV